MIRTPEPAEAGAVVAWFEALEDGLWGKVAGGLELAILDAGGGRHAILVPERLLRLAPALLAGDTTTGGLPIGTLGPDGFHIDLQGAVRLARHTRAGTVAVNEHAGRVFLYGRGILGTSVLFHDPLLRPGASCIVTDVRGEAIGVGLVVGSFKGKGEAVSAVHDLGTYLRDQDE